MHSMWLVCVLTDAIENCDSEWSFAWGICGQSKMLHVDEAPGLPWSAPAG